jgi:hypothetical protein
VGAVEIDMHLVVKYHSIVELPSVPMMMRQRPAGSLPLRA